MSLRERLEGKARRRLSVRVQVTDPAADREAVSAAQTLLLAAQAAPEAHDVPAAQDAYDAAVAAFLGNFEDVPFEALDPKDFEALVDAHSRADDIDRDGLLAALAAACVVDEDLRDEAWWRAQLARPEWTTGEKDDLYHRLFTELHYSVPSGAIPKG
ncbi:hypothetical protein GXB85_04710 [Cellulomonas sp. APG4]|uniref:hypothetical protein n=1 Tax=Cellulomonas sp. APG4 TaxID=1538656 RepID=UPI001379FF93|nr:hypothetical protein [Cellulomonas sp. APG4]NCT90255.1 hypothetical protein [Cellulomonas sp. APG4]